MAERGNLFADLPARLAQEEFLTLLAAPGLRIERIVSRGQSSAADFWYDRRSPNGCCCSPAPPR